MTHPDSSEVVTSTIPHVAPKVAISSPPGVHRGLVLGLAAHGHRAVAVGGQARDLFLTSEDGETFKSGISVGHGLRAAWLTDEELWVVGEYGYVARSKNFGRTWQRVPTKGTTCFFGVVPDTTGAMWIAGNGNSIFIAAPGAESDAPLRAKSFGKWTGVINASRIGVFVTTDAPGRLFVGNTRGKSVALKETSLACDVSLRMAAMTPSGAIIAIGEKGHVYRADDVDGAFARVSVPSSVNLLGIDAFPDGRVAVAGENGVLLVSYDDGRTFESLAQSVTTANFWACKRHGDVILVAGSDGVILRLGEQQPGWKESASAAFAIATPAAPEVRAPESMVVGHPSWAAPPPSTLVQDWTAPASARVERLANGVFVSPELRAWLYPRRGGIAVPVRPLPTLHEAWSHLRRAFWSSDHEMLEGPDRRAGFQRDKPRPPSGIWQLVTASSGQKRRLGERILDASPRAGTFEDDVALVSLSLSKYGFDFVKLHQDIIQTAVTDFLIASVGMVEATRRLFTGLDDELPYSDAGPFARLRELLATTDDPTYVAARGAAIETCHNETARTKPDRDRVVDLACALSFTFPLGPASGPEERDAHDRALGFIGKFGDLGVAHACILAAGDLKTLELVLAKNGKMRNEMFSGSPRLYLASVLESAGKSALPALLRLKPTSPWESDARYNGLWCQLLAHVDDERVLETLLTEKQHGFWGVVALARVAHFDRARIERIAPAHGGEALLGAIAEAAPTFPVPPTLLDAERSLDTSSIPFAYTPAVVPVRPSLLTRTSLAPEATWRDEERAIEARDTSRVGWDGVLLSKCTPEALAAFVAHQEQWALPTSIDIQDLTPAALRPRLHALGFVITAYGAQWTLPRVMLRSGLAELPLLLAALESPEGNEHALVAAQPFGDVSIVPSIAVAFAGKKNKAIARSWLLRHPRHAVTGAVALLETSARDDASRVLRYLGARGHRETILAVAATIALTKDVTGILDTDPLTAPKVKRPVLPRFVTSAALPPLVTASGAHGSKEDIAKLLVELAFSNADEIHPGVVAAKARYTAASRAAFAWALFDAWLLAGADPKHGYCMQAIGFWGDDEQARKLTALAKAWPGQQASARAQAALDALLNIGTDTALIQINLLAEKSKFPAFKEAAGERIRAIADARGLTSDELADRLVPTLGLEETGGDVLDFGARTFVVSFGPDLVPVVKDGARVLADLPKPTKADDATLAKDAKARFTAMKKDARTSASLQITRLERAMLTERRIDGSLFLAGFARHPWMSHLARRLVWGAFVDGSLRQTFRVAEDGTLADQDDRAFTLETLAGASVTPLHPLLLAEGELTRWSTVFADYEILQPFPQLERPVFRLHDAELATPSLVRFEGKTVPYAALRGLEARGWEPWVDASVQMSKRLASGGVAVLYTDPGWAPGEPAAEIADQTLEGLHLHDRSSFGELRPVERSELVYDLERLFP